MAPPAFDRVIRTCLAKDPEERWQSAGNLARELRWIAQSPAAGLPAAAPRLAKESRGPLRGCCSSEASPWPTRSIDCEIAGPPPFTPSWSRRTTRRFI
jgi:hypothetical protein